MKKLVGVVVVFAVIAFTWLISHQLSIQKASRYHTKISVEQVASVTVLVGVDEELTLTKEQQLAMIEAFNSSKFVDDNDELAGPTYDCHASIRLKDGQRISLGGCKERQEVQRRDNIQPSNQSGTEIVAYFIESPQMAQIIREVLHSMK